MTSINQHPVYLGRRAKQLLALAAISMSAMAWADEPARSQPARQGFYQAPPEPARRATPTRPQYNGAPAANNPNHFYREGGEINHVPVPDFPYESGDQDRPTHRPHHRWPAYYPYYDNRTYVGEQPVDIDGDGRSEYVEDDYRNCYRVVYEDGHRTLEDVRSKYCR